MRSTQAKNGHLGTGSPKSFIPPLILEQGVNFDSDVPRGAVRTDHRRLDPAGGRLAEPQELQLL